MRELRRLCRRVSLTRPRRETGAVAVEMALVTFFILTPLLMGVVTSGYSYSHALGLTNAVREGARFAAITPYPPASGIWQDDVIARTRAYQADDAANTSRICVDLYKQGATPANVISSCNGDSSLGTPPTFIPPSGTPAGTCVVRVWGARHFTINAVLIKLSDRVMTRQSIAVYERAKCG